MSTSHVLKELQIERQRQVGVKGYRASHDDGHINGELSLAAALYAIPYSQHPGVKQDDFVGLHMALELGNGWTLKPEADRRRRLIKAAALICAEIERLDRIERPSTKVSSFFMEHELRAYLRPGDIISHTRCMEVLEEHRFDGWDGHWITGRPTQATARLSRHGTMARANDIAPGNVTHINRESVRWIDFTAVRP